MQPTRRSNARLQVIVEGPTQQDVAYGSFAAGTGSRLLWDLLKKEGISRDEVDVTSALLCRTKRRVSKKDLKKALKCCAPRLERDIAESAPPVVLALGARALQALTGKAQITVWMGSPLAITTWKGTKRKPGNPAILARQVLPTVSTNACWADPFAKPFFSAHVKRAVKMAKGALPEWRWPRIVTSFDADEAGLLAALDDVAAAPYLATDTETAGLHYHDELKDVAISSETLAVCVQWLTASDRIKDRVRIILESSTPKALQNGMFDHFVFRANGIHLNGFAWDTALGSAVIAPRLPKRLGHQMCLYSNAPRFKSDFKAGNKNPWKSEKKARERAEYCAKDAFSTLWLALHVHPPLLAKTHKGEEQFRDLMAELKIAIKMREYGVWIDQTRLAGISGRLERAIAIVSERLQRKVREAGYEGEFLPDAPAHIRKLFLTTLGLTTKKKTAKGAYSYSADQVLVFAESEDPKVRRLAKAILIYRRFQKLLAANRKLPDFIDADGRVRPSWNPGGAATRRWSCDRPNLQNVAKERKE